MRMSENKDMVESVVRDVEVINIITTYDASRINSRFHIVMESERVGICAYDVWFDVAEPPLPVKKVLDAYFVETYKTFEGLVQSMLEKFGWQGYADYGVSKLMAFKYTDKL